MLSSSTNTSSVVKKQQRNIIIEKDDGGFGFQLCGSKPVEIASISEDGPANRAGLIPGDEIVKVNGSYVYDCEHNLVVNAILNAGSTVNLTLTSSSLSPTTTTTTTSSCLVSSEVCSDDLPSTSCLLNLADVSNLQHMSTSKTNLLSPESMCLSSIDDSSYLGSNDDIASKRMFDFEWKLLNPTFGSSVSTTPQGPSSTCKREMNNSRSNNSSNSKDFNGKSNLFKYQLLRESKETIASSIESNDGEDDIDDEDASIEVNDQNYDVPDGMMNILNFSTLSSKKKSENKLKKSRKKAFTLLEEMNIVDVQVLIITLLGYKFEIISNLSGKSTNISSGNSCTSIYSKNSKGKISSLRKGSSRGSFMPKSISPEDLLWLKESQKLMCLISHSLNLVGNDINYLLFYTLATLIQHELNATSSSSLTSSSSASSSSSSSPSPSPCSQFVQSDINEALFELISIFLLPDSPLALTKLPSHLNSQAQLDLLTSSFMTISSSSSTCSNDTFNFNQCQLQQLLVPYINFAREVVNDGIIKSFNRVKELELFPSAVQMSILGFLSKEKKKLARESMGRLLIEALHFDAEPSTDSNSNLPQDVNLFSHSDSLISCLKYLYQGQPLKGDHSESVPYSCSLARVFALLSVFYHFFPHSIFFNFSSNIHSQLKPLILLNSFIKSKCKTNESITNDLPKRKSPLLSTFSNDLLTNLPYVLPLSSPRQNRKNNFENSYSPSKTLFQTVVKKKNINLPVSLVPGHLVESPSFETVSSICYCSACGHILWGKKFYLLVCSRCDVKYHYWCYFTCLLFDTPIIHPCLTKEQDTESITREVDFDSESETESVEQESIERNKKALEFCEMFPEFVLSSSSSNCSSASESNLESDFLLTIDSSEKMLPCDEVKTSKELQLTKEDLLITTCSNFGSNTVDVNKIINEDEEEIMAKKKRDERVKRKLKQRKMNTLELIKTEKSFGKKLILLNDLFYVPIIRFTNTLTEDEVKKIFSNHLQLIKLHIELYNCLRKQVKPSLRIRSDKIDWKLIANSFESIFLSLGPEIKENFSLFCSNFISASELLKVKMKRKEMFAGILADAECSADLEKYKLTDLLVAPIQRIMRYPLLLAEICNTFDLINEWSSVDFIEKETKAKSTFDSVVKIIKDIVNEVNESEPKLQFIHC